MAGIFTCSGGGEGNPHKEVQFGLDESEFKIYGSGYCEDVTEQCPECEEELHIRVPLP